MKKRTAKRFATVRFYDFPDFKNPPVYWIVLIFSKYEKHKEIERLKIQKYGERNMTRFWECLKKDAARK